MTRLVRLQSGPGHRLGRAVAASGRLVVAGAPGDAQGGVDAGSATLWELEGGHWREEATLRVAEPGRNDRFGASVAVSGELACVGAPGRRESIERVGAAHVFFWHRKRLVHEAVLRPAGVERWGAFGEAVAIDGNLALVGAPGAADDARSTGAAFAFRWSGRDWVGEAELAPPGLEEGARAGAALALAGTTALVAAPGGDPAVHVYTRTRAGWVHVDRLLPDPRLGGGSAQRFGASVALGPGVAAVGAPGDPAEEPEPEPTDEPSPGPGEDPRADAIVASLIGSPASDSTPGREPVAPLAPRLPLFRPPLGRRPTPPPRGTGRVYVFRFVAGRWYREAILEAPPGAAGFGASVALAGDELVVGATRPEQGAPSGSAFHYTRATGAWTLRARLDAGASPEGDGFGSAVALASGDLAVVGAPRENGASGALYVLAPAAVVAAPAPEAPPEAVPPESDDSPPSDEPSEGVVTTVGATPATPPPTTPTPSGPAGGDAFVTTDDAYATVVVGGTLFPGDATTAEHAGKLRVRDYRSGFRRPVIGNASGALQLDAVAFSVGWGAASPLFAQALDRNDELEVVFEFIGRDATGAELVTRVVRLFGARVVRVESEFAGGDAPLAQRIELAYASLEADGGHSTAVLEWANQV